MMYQSITTTAFKRRTYWNSERLIVLRSYSRQTTVGIPLSGSFPRLGRLLVMILETFPEPGIQTQADRLQEIGKEFFFFNLTTLLSV